jgi:hypothetical protein
VTAVIENGFRGTPRAVKKALWKNTQTFARVAYLRGDNARYD